MTPSKDELKRNDFIHWMGEEDIDISNYNSLLAVHKVGITYLIFKNCTLPASYKRSSSMQVII